MTVQTPPDSWRLFAGWLPNLAPGRYQDRDVFERSNRPSNGVFGILNSIVRLLARWTTVESPQSYLYMIATNLIRDHWRKTERERRALRSVTAGSAGDPVAFPVQDVDVRNLIASLPLRLRDPFLLHYYGGFGLKEVASLLHRPEGTIKAHLFAARARLKTALGERDG
jgi:RNA polymerase sigma-70 factor, ECF subfamily